MSKVGMHPIVQGGGNTVISVVPKVKGQGESSIQLAFCDAISFTAPSQKLKSEVIQGISSKYPDMIVPPGAAYGEGSMSLTIIESYLARAWEQLGFTVAGKNNKQATMYDVADAIANGTIGELTVQQIITDPVKKSNGANYGFMRTYEGCVITGFSDLHDSPTLGSGILKGSIDITYRYYWDSELQATV